MFAWSSSIPARGVLWKTRALNSYDAESLPSGGLHHHPAFQAIDHLGPQRCQACYLSGNVVCFDINVNPALVVDALDLDDGLVGRCGQHAVIAASPWMVGIDRATQRISPEPGGLIYIRYTAINQKSAKTRMMHSRLS